MKLITQRWYLALFFIPFLVNVISGIITWNDIKNNPYIVITIVLLIYSLVITAEFWLYFKQKTIKISDHDKLIISELIHTLNLDFVNESLKNHDAYIGYKFKHISAFASFNHKSKELKYRLINTELQKKVDAIADAFEPFDELVSSYLFGSRNTEVHWLVHADYILSDTAARKKRGNELNEKARILYTKIELLVKELKRLGFTHLSPPQKINIRKSKYWNNQHHQDFT